VDLPDAEKKFEDMFTHFNTIYERDGHQTDEQTPHNGLASPVFARQKFTIQL